MYLCRQARFQKEIVFDGVCTCLWVHECAGTYVQWMWVLVCRYTCAGVCMWGLMCRCICTGVYLCVVRRVQVYACEYVYVQILMWKCIHVGTCVCIGRYTCAGTCMWTCVCAGANVQVYVYGHLCVRVCMCRCMCMGMSVSVHIRRSQRRMPGALLHHTWPCSLETESLTELAAWHWASPCGPPTHTPQSSGVSGIHGYACFVKWVLWIPTGDSMLV